MTEAAATQVKDKPLPTDGLAGLLLNRAKSLVEEKIFNGLTDGNRFFKGSFSNFLMLAQADRAFLEVEYSKVKVVNELPTEELKTKYGQVGAAKHLIQQAMVASALETMSSIAGKVRPSGIEVEIVRNLVLEVVGKK